MSMGYIVGYMQDGLEPAVHVGADDDRMLHDRMLHDGVRIVSVLHLCIPSLGPGPSSGNGSVSKTACWNCQYGLARIAVDIDALLLPYATLLGLGVR